MSSYFKDFTVVVVTIFIRDCVPKLRCAYQKRFIDPKKAHQQVFLDQADWFEERAAKLAVFRFELGQEPGPDKFKLAQLGIEARPTG